MHSESRTVLLLSLLGLFALVPQPLHAQSAPPANRFNQTFLHWHDGDQLSGTLVSADAELLTWQSPLFTEPLRIRVSHLSALKFPTLPEETNSDKDIFRVLFRNGDVLYGTFVGITEDTLTIQSSRTGTTQLKRNEIRLLQRLQLSAGVVFNGPLGLRGWQPAFRRSSQDEEMLLQMRRAVMQNAERQMGKKSEESAAATTQPRWTADPDGSLKTSREDATLFLPLTLPKKALIEVQLNFGNRPSFLMSVGRNGKSGLRVETWIDSLVLARKETFTLLKPLNDQEKTLHLQLFADFSSGTASVFLATGEKLGDISFDPQQLSEGEPAPDPALSPDALAATKEGRYGMLFRNGAGAMTIRRLRISEWDGREPQVVNGTGTRVETLAGDVLFGNIRPNPAQSDGLTLEQQNGSRDLKISELSTMVFQIDQQATETGKTQLSWSDGAAISGNLVSIRDGAAELLTSWSTAPVICQTNTLSAVTFARSEVKETTQDQLFHADGSLQGSLSFDGPADSPIRWMPLGGVQSVALAQNGNARILRRSGIAHFSENPDLLKGFPDVVYLSNDDVLPCRVDLWNEDSVSLSSPLAGMKTLPLSAIRAVELSASNRTHQRDFAAPEWKGRVVRSDDRKSIQFRGNVSYTHPSILTGDTIRFQLQWPPQCYGHLMVSLCGGSGRLSKEASHVVFTIMENSLRIHDQPLSPQQQNGFFGGFNMQNQKDLVRVPKRKADVRLVMRDGKIFINVNGQDVTSFRLNPAGAETRSLAFHANINSAGQTVVNGLVKEGSGVQISEFEIDNLSGGSIRQFIEDEVRQTTLTVPRFRRNNPPTHALIASNGDVLRGRLVSINAEDVQFESRLEPLRINRSRIAAIVQLESRKKEPSEQSSAEDSGFITGPTEENNSQVQLFLADGYRITAMPEKLDAESLVCSSKVLGPIRIPARSIQEMRIGNPEDAPVAIAFQQWIAEPAKEPDWDVPQSDGGNSEAAALIGSIAPDFELPRLDGSTFRLSEHKDKVIILDFWATWCGPCVAALPEYLSAVRKFDTEKVIFVAVNQQESADQIRAFLAEKKLTPLVALDRTGSVGEQFRVSGIPHTVVISPGNLVEDVHVGYRPGSAEELQTTVQQMLDGTWKRPAPPAPGSDAGPREQPDAGNAPASDVPAKE